MRQKLEVLPEKYRKALQLIEAGNHSYREVARLCGIGEASFYDLVEGKAKNNDRVQELFSKELTEISRRLDKEIRDLVKNNKKSTQYLINNWLADQKHKKKVDTKMMSTLVSVANALSKSTPNVEIGSFTYQKGLSPEDIYAEFKRLSGLASQRKPVSGSAPRRTREILMASRPGIAAEEEPKDSLLRAEPETEELSPEREPD